MEILEEIAEKIKNLEAGPTLELVEKAVGEGIPANDVIKKGLAVGLGEVGRMYEEKEYFLSELLMSARIMSRAVDTLKPLLEGEEMSSSGKVLLGTVEGDMHDIGKNLLRALLELSGFDVTDLGIDVKKDVFIQAIKDDHYDLVCLSCLLSVTLPMMRDVVSEITALGGDRPKILVGGQPITPELAEEMGSDAYGKDAWDGVAVAKSLLGA